MGGRVRWFALALGVLSTACASDTFVCSEDSMCVNENIVGICQPGGNCSFPDPACDSGYRYGDSADASVSGTCVPLDGTGSATSTATSGGGGTSGDSPTTLGVDGTATSTTSAPGTTTTEGADTSTDGSGTGVTGGPNLVFVTSESTPVGSLGGLAGADAMCARLAAASNLDGTYVAWLSDSGTDARDRLAGARGWVRLDGLVFADTVDDIATGNIYNPVYLDETGAPIDSNMATGTLADGTAAPETCADWTSADAGDDYRRGESHHVHPDWTTRSSIACNQNSRVYCFGVDHETPVPPPTSQMGRIAFATSQTLSTDGGRQAFDDACTQEAEAAGLPGTYLAAVATSTSSIASRFDLGGEPWVNTLGQIVVADPMDLAGGLPVVDAAIRWNAEGDAAVVRVWTGAPNTGALGTGSCGDWSAQAEDASGIVGAPTSVVEWFNDSMTQCSFEYGVYCFQE